ncbi:UNVERIFIED_CONTAM: hypothetical protein FKN15_024200 [Acipenser sinensis]
MISSDGDKNSSPGTSPASSRSLSLLQIHSPCAEEQSLALQVSHERSFSELPLLLCGRELDFLTQRLQWTDRLPLV